MSCSPASFIIIATYLSIVIIIIQDSTAVQRPHAIFIHLYLLSSTKLPISSLHIIQCLPCLLLPSLGCHSVTLIVHLLSVRHIMFSVCVHFFPFNCSSSLSYEILQTTIFSCRNAVFEDLLEICKDYLTYLHYCLDA